jgi:glucose/mannose-6-phosphate isomerase
MPESNPFDPQDMNAAIEALGANLKSGWQLGLKLETPKVGSLRQVVICGVGGSAIGGDFTTAYLTDKLPIPVLAHRNYGLPGWAKGPETLVICSSHSGNTEETLSSFNEALQRGCSLMSICTGGKLAELSENNGKNCWIFEHVGQPRTAIGWTVGLLLALYFRLGLIEDQSAAVEEAAAILAEGTTKLGNDSPVSSNPAKRLAGQLLGRNIVIYGSGELDVIARRWKSEINELAKAWAAFEGIPEMNHNALAGLRHPESLYEHTSAIFLRSDFDHARNRKRVEYSQGFFLEAGVAVDSVRARGEGKLAQMFSLLQFGDYVSYYLALAYGEDPTPIEVLNKLKRLLAD